MNDKIVPHLWFDKEAVQAAKFYTSVFPLSKVKKVTQIHNTPSGDCDIVSFQLAGKPFMSISAGPYFTFNPSISFMYSTTSVKEVDAIWKKLTKHGKILMPLEKYPFSDHYGWVQDKFGLSWQIGVIKGMPAGQQCITPTLMFTDKVLGKAEEAAKFYMKIFKKSKTNGMFYYGKGMKPNKEGTLQYGSITIEGYEMAMMDSGLAHGVGFNEAISFIVNCKDQKEIDYYWNKLSADPKAEQCGWLKDKFGVSWQIVPAAMEKMMQTKDKKALARVTQAFLKMKKFNIKKLQEAFDGK